MPPSPPFPGSKPWASAVILLVLAGTGLVLAFRSGSYVPGSWLPVVLGIAAVTAMLAAFLPGWSLGRNASIFLAVFAGLVLLAGASLFWADSPAQAWEETNRSFLYLLGLILVVTAVRWGGTRTLRFLVAVVAGMVTIVGTAVVIRLVTTGDPAGLFQGGRLHYPVSYWNGLGALLTLGFWPMLGLASERRMPVWATSLLVGAAVALAELALLPESRGTLWTFSLVVPFFVLVTPHRFRALALLGVVVATVALAWSPLVAVYEAFTGAGAGAGAGTGPGAAGPRAALDTALVALAWSVVGAAAVAAVIRVVEARISPLPAGAVRVTAAVLVAAVLAAATLGGLALRAEVGDLTEFAAEQWTEFTGDTFGETEGGSRFTAVGLTGRLQQWRIAGQAFREQPLTGLGAQNYEYYFYRHRETGLQVRQPHSQPMQVLSELGIGGILLYAGFFIGAMIWGLFARFRARRPENQVATAALLVTALSWLIHSSADWLWQLSGVTWPAVLVFGGLIAAGPRTTPAHPNDNGRSTNGFSGNLLRGAAGAIAVIAFLSALLPYLSMRYTDDVAYASVASNPNQAIHASQTAATLNPFSPRPYKVQVSTYELLATRAAEPGDHALRLAYLSLAAAAQEEAFARDPAWHLALSAAKKVEALATATAEAGDGGPGETDAVSPQALGASRAQTIDTVSAVAERAGELRAMGVRELLARARNHYEEAARLNPRAAPSRRQ